MDDLELFLPEPHLVTTRAGRVAILPLLFGVVGPFSRAATKPAEHLMQGKFVEALQLHEADVRTMIVLGSGLKAEVVNGLYADDIVRLAAAIVSVNTDFFSQCIAPALAQAETTAMQTLLRMTSAGISSSPSSGPAATH